MDLNKACPKDPFPLPCIDQIMDSTSGCDTGLQELKTYLSSVPTLVAPKPQESLLLYLAATNQVVSAALVAQREVEEAESGQTAAES